MTEWSKLEHAHGKATDLPGLLAQLDGKDPTRAAGMIAERFEIGPVSALAPLVEALLALLADVRRKDRALLWQLVVSVVWPEPQLYSLDPFKLPKGAPKPLKQAVAAIEDSAALSRDVAVKDEAIAAAACWVASFLPAPTEELVEAVVARAKKKADGAGRTRAVLARAMLVRRGFVIAEEAKERPGAKADERPLQALVRRIVSKKLSRDDAEVLAQWLEKGHADDLQLGADLDLANLAALALRGGADATLAPSLVRAVLSARDRDRLRNLELLSAVLFPEARPLTPQTLSDAQREALRALVDAGVDIALPAQGLHTSASVRALLKAGAADERAVPKGASTAAGEVAKLPAPIERSITLGPSARPAWQWFDAELAGEVSNEQLIEAFEAAFSEPERWALLREAVVAERGHASPAMSFVERLSASLSPPPSEVDTFVDSAVAAGFDCLPARALLGVLSLLKVGAKGGPREELLERLATVAVGGNDDAVIARMLKALPPDIARRAEQ